MSYISQQKFCKKCNSIYNLSIFGQEFMNLCFEIIVLSEAKEKGLWTSNMSKPNEKSETE